MLEIIRTDLCSQSVRILDMTWQSTTNFKFRTVRRIIYVIYTPPISCVVNYNTDWININLNFSRLFLSLYFEYVDWRLAKIGNISTQTTRRVD